MVLLVCPHCESRYRIDAERVTAQGARARCARCDRLFVVGGQRDHAVLPDPSVGPAETRPTGGSRLASLSGAGPDPFASLDEPEIGSAPAVDPGPAGVEPLASPVSPAPSPAAAPPASTSPPPIRALPPADASPPADSTGSGPVPAEVDPVLELIRGGGPQGSPPQVAMRVVRGGGDPEQEQGEDSSIPEQVAELVLGDELACRLAEDLIAALAATYPEKIVRARSDGQWEFHLGEVIRGARTDFRAAVSAPGDERDGLFEAALRQLMQQSGSSSSALDATPDAIPDAIPGANPDADGELRGSGGPS